jgi:hypothetical protein
MVVLLNPNSFANIRQHQCVLTSAGFCWARRMIRACPAGVAFEVYFPDAVLLSRLILTLRIVFSTWKRSGHSRPKSARSLDDSVRRPTPESAALETHHQPEALSTVPIAPTLLFVRHSPAATLDYRPPLFDASASPYVSPGRSTSMPTRRLLMQRIYR